jgi:hypothetical protein
MSYSSNVRVPSVLSRERKPPVTTHIPTPSDIFGCWYMAASSSSYLHDRKRSITVTYQENTQGNVPKGAFDEVMAYYSGNSKKQSFTRGISSPSAAGAGIFDWRGTGWMRMIFARWEIIGFGPLETGHKPTMVVFVHKSLFGSQSLSICRKEEDVLSEEDLHTILRALRGLGNEALDQELDKVQAISRE